MLVMLDRVASRAVLDLLLAPLLLFTLILVYAGCSGRGTLSLYLDVSPSPEGYWLQAKFQNVGKSDLRIWESGFWPNTRIVCHDESGHAPPLTEEGKRLVGAFSPGGARDKNYLVNLKPYQVHNGDPVLLDRVFLLDRSKAYLVHIVYEEAADEGWKGSVTSNIVRIDHSRSPDVPRAP